MRKKISSRLCLATVCLLAATNTGCLTTERHASKSPARNSAMGLPSQAKADAAVAKAEHNALPTDQGVKLHLDIGKALEGREEFDSAIAEYQQALQALDGPGRHPGGVKVNNDLRALAERRMAGVLERLGRFDQAEVHYRIAFKNAPRDAKVWNDYGFGKALQGRWEESEKALRTAVKIDPANPRYQTNLGLTLASEGKTAEALKILTRAGGAPWARHNIAIALLKQGKLSAAREQLSNALVLAPEQSSSRAALKQIDDAIARAETKPNPLKTLDADPVVLRASAVE